MRMLKFCGYAVVLVLAAGLCQSAPAQQPLVQQTPDQQINDFSLAGYGDRGEKSWELQGTTADIMTETVKLNKVVGNLYSKDDTIKLTADKGDFNKADGKVHLENNVIVTTASGAELTTDSLDWDRKNQRVSTKDQVNIHRDSIDVQAQGAHGKPDLKQVSLEKAVTVNIKPDQKGLKETIVVTCDGPLQIDYAQNIATLKHNVKVERTDSTIYSDMMKIYFSPAKTPQETAAEEKQQAEEQSGHIYVATGKDKPAAKSSIEKSGLFGSKIKKIIARGNVRVIRGENVSYSKEAVYKATDKKITLKGRTKMVLISKEGSPDASFGN